MLLTFILLAVVQLCVAYHTRYPSKQTADSAAPSIKDGHWVNTWASMPQLTEPANLPSSPYVYRNRHSKRVHAESSSRTAPQASFSMRRYGRRCTYQLVQNKSGFGYRTRSARTISLSRLLLSLCHTMALPVLAPSCLALLRPWPLAATPHS